MITRLLYLGFAFPPGLQHLHPGLNPAGHNFETGLMRAFPKDWDIRSVGILPVEPPDNIDPAKSPGLPHALVLQDRKPEQIHRRLALRRLIQAFQQWEQAGWVPDAVLVYNLSPVYNGFIRWLARKSRAQRPKLIVLFADSSTLGHPVSWSKRLRYRFKPLVFPEEEMLRLFDGTIALSRDTRWFWDANNIPWLWMPGGCDPALAPAHNAPAPSTEVAFGYFGALAAHAGILPLVEAFIGAELPATLHVCGYGKLGPVIEGLARSHSRIKYHGLLDQPSDCLDLAQTWDVLVNPRPRGWGNENNFPSKVFQYAMTGRAILTTRLAGVDDVLGEDAFYLEDGDFAQTMPAMLHRLAEWPRTELHQRGCRLRARVMEQYSWRNQAGHMAEFIRREIDRSPD